MHFFSAFASCILIAGASYGVGLAVGFIFGIPRDIQNIHSSINSPKNAKVWAYNDNLAQISDWLTKLIVGAGLTQLVNVGPALASIGNFLVGSFQGHDISDISNSKVFSIARNASIGCVLYFLILGFLTTTVRLIF